MGMSWDGISNKVLLSSNVPGVFLVSEGRSNIVSRSCDVCRPPSASIQNSIVSRNHPAAASSAQLVTLSVR